MNHFGVLVMMLLLLAIATPALVANPASPSEAAPKRAAGEQATTPSTDALTQISQADHSVTTPPSRPASRERTRRPARIDLSMPYYRFGRLPIRVKD